MTVIDTFFFFFFAKKRVTICWFKSSVFMFRGLNHLLTELPRVDSDAWLTDVSFSPHPHVFQLPPISTFTVSACSLLTWNVSWCKRVFTLIGLSQWPLQWELWWPGALRGSWECWGNCSNVSGTGQSAPSSCSGTFHQWLSWRVWLPAPLQSV